MVPVAANWYTLSVIPRKRTPRSRYVALVVLSVSLGFVASARAGLHYSGEQFAQLPSQWRGFLLDLRTLRSIAVKPAGAVPASPARQRYLRGAQELEKAVGNRKLTADELADLGAMYVRLGEAA